MPRYGEQLIDAAVRLGPGDEAAYRAEAAGANLVAAVVRFADERAPNIRSSRDYEGEEKGPRLIALSPLPPAEPSPRTAYYLEADSEADDWLARPALLQTARRLWRADCSLTASLRPGQIPGLMRLAAAAPAMDLVIALPATDVAAWRDGLSLLAAAPNVTMRLPPPGSAEPAMTIRTLVQIFGPTRCLFGSDWPDCSRGEGFARRYTAIRDLLVDLSATDQCAIFYDNATAIYGISG